MATILLSSVGNLFGPVGQIVGSLAGSAIDNALFAPNDIEGARLRELAVTGSSYGTPIPRQYGTMRAPGTIIWSTDLQEHRDRHGGGKGQPKTVLYSYSISFAVAISSRPIERIGRIWAGGSLLRGSAGDLKTGGSLRIYKGHRDQPRDPLLEAALGDECPAFRGCAYAVFEDLDLTDFGNRIPSLNFEVFAGDGSRLIELLLADSGLGDGDGARFGELEGFGHEGGQVRQVLQLVDQLHPVTPQTDPHGITIRSATRVGNTPIALKPPASWEDGDFGQQGGIAQIRSSDTKTQLAALRYYDPARDFQPGVQYAGTADATSRTLQFPGALAADDALKLAREANIRAAISRQTISWRCAELDPAIRPGSLVTAPDHQGIFKVAGWEWREGGIELELVRYRPSAPVSVLPRTDAGSHWSAPDRLPSTTRLRVFETPWDGVGARDTRTVFAAPCAPTGHWPGCTLYSERDGTLTPLGLAANERAVSGHLIAPGTSSNAVRFEPLATLTVQLLDYEAAFPASSLEGIAQGENHLLVGREIIQFTDTRARGNGVWELSGLLRGRGGSESEARFGHPAGTLVTLLDDRLIALPDNVLRSGTDRFAALGTFDEQPALAELENIGASQSPLSPVHGRMVRRGDGSAQLSWTRRARGQWLWHDGIDVPLIEEAERYEVIFGPPRSPAERWTVGTPRLDIPAAQVETLLAANGPADLWVVQAGTYGKSRRLRLGRLD